MTTTVMPDVADVTAQPCACGLPAEAGCHHDDGGPCRCRRDSHWFGCHYLAWTMAHIDEDGEPIECADSGCFCHDDASGEDQ